LLVGVALTFAADRVLRGVLFGVSPFDALTLAESTLVLAIVATLAVALPALKAARVAAVQALRGE
jgi:ABC-type antimicrobial peptide transport system permease subunit